VPVAWQLYLPEDWAADPVRRAQAGVPEELRFATKTQIALGAITVASSFITFSSSSCTISVPRVFHSG
jgi:SRSO17 transposase